MHPAEGALSASFAALNPAPPHCVEQHLEQRAVRHDVVPVAALRRSHPLQAATLFANASDGLRHEQALAALPDALPAILRHPFLTVDGSLVWVSWLKMGFFFEEKRKEKISEKICESSSRVVRHNVAGATNGCSRQADAGV
jgi:hypothetical protein